MAVIVNNNLDKLLRPGGAIYQQAMGIGFKVDGALKVANPVKTGRSRSGWEIKTETNGMTMTVTIYNDVNYTGYISRKGTKEPKGIFICQAATRALAPIPVKCVL